MFKCAIIYSTSLPTRKDVTDAISEHSVVVIKNKRTLGNSRFNKLVITSSSRETMSSFLKDANKNTYADIKVCYLRPVHD